VGMQMGIDGLDQLKVELFDELDVAVDLLQHRIDDQRLAAVPAGQQVGVGAGYAVEKLAKDHNVLNDWKNLLRHRQEDKSSLIRPKGRKNVYSSLAHFAGHAAVHHDIY